MKLIVDGKHCNVTIVKDTNAREISYIYDGDGEIDEKISSKAIKLTVVDDSLDNSNFSNITISNGTNITFKGTGSITVNGRAINSNFSGNVINNGKIIASKPEKLTITITNECSNVTCFTTSGYVNLIDAHKMLSITCETISGAIEIGECYKIRAKAPRGLSL